jgi:hypothetical protein
MKTRIGVPLLGTLLLAACVPHASNPGGAVVLEERVALVREEDRDIATREFAVDSDGVLVAIVDEAMTHVRLTLSILGRQAGNIEPVEVENRLAGAGTEIAAMEGREDSPRVSPRTGTTNPPRHVARNPGLGTVSASLRSSVNGAGSASWAPRQPPFGPYVQLVPPTCARPRLPSSRSLATYASQR